MAAYNWELERDLYLARYQGNAAEVARLEEAMAANQAACNHEPNPEKPERCYKCGASALPAVRKCKIVLPESVKETA